MRFSTFVGVVIVVLSQANSGLSASGPTQAELQRALTELLPDHVEVTAFELEATQNLGNDVEPLYSSRIRARLTLAEDLFRLAGKYNGRDILEQVAKTGLQEDVYYIASSDLYQGAWRSRFRTQGPCFDRTCTAQDPCVRETADGITAPACLVGSDENILSRSTAPTQALLEGDQDYNALISPIDDMIANSKERSPPIISASSPTKNGSVQYAVQKNYLVYNSPEQQRFIWYGDITKLTNGWTKRILRRRVASQDSHITFVVYTSLTDFTHVYFPRFHDYEEFRSQLETSYKKWREEYCRSDGYRVPATCSTSLNASLELVCSYRGTLLADQWLEMKREGPWPRIELAGNIDSCVLIHSDTHGAMRECSGEKEKIILANKRAWFRVEKGQLGNVCFHGFEYTGYCHECK